MGNRGKNVAGKVKWQGKVTDRTNRVGGAVCSKGKVGSRGKTVAGKVKWQ